LRELLRGAPFGLKAEVLNQQGKLIKYFKINYLIIDGVQFTLLFKVDTKNP